MNPNTDAVMGSSKAQGFDEDLLSELLSGEHGGHVLLEALSAALCEELFFFFSLSLSQHVAHVWEKNAAAFS